MPQQPPMMPQGMPEGMPPAEQPEMEGEMAEGGEALVLDPQQLSEAGLDSLQEGDKFTVMLHGTVVSTEGGISITVDQLMDGSLGEMSGGETEEDTEGPEKEEAFQKPKMKVQSPSESGFKF